MKYLDCLNVFINFSKFHISGYGRAGPLRLRLEAAKPCGLCPRTLRIKHVFSQLPSTEPDVISGFLIEGLDIIYIYIYTYCEYFVSKNISYFF